MTGTSHDPNMPTAGVVTRAARATADGLGGPEPEEVIANRCGDVLIKHTVLKADHFPSCHNTKLTPILEGAPNFRKVDGLRVYGVAIPTLSGLRQVMNAMGAQKGSRKVFWQNLREEPLIFINGNPFVVREADQPFSNLEYTGIDRTRVEDMEIRLKADILAEAERFDGRILVMHENEDLSLYDHWEAVTPADVQTPQEVYEELKADGYDVDYLRVPVTDEKAPKDEDFEMLVSRLWNIPDDAGVIFNCQMGRGRTTTGMVIGSLLYLRKMEAFPIKKGKQETRDIVPEWFKSATAPLAARGPLPPVKEGSLESRLKAGNYGAVRSLLRALEKGNEAKVLLDSVIDACAAMQNLREGIFSYRSRFLKEAREKQRNVLLSVCLEYLERYYMLLAFTGYLCSASFDPGSPTHQPFPVWMAERPELRSILMRLLRRNSMAALELHQRTPGAGPGSSGELSLGSSPKAGVLIGSSSGGGGVDHDVVAQRTGAVLGAFSILKEDNFPGMQSSKVPQLIEGAPNFRGLPGMPIFGVGMPTLDGIMGVLRTVAGSTSPNAGKRCVALWINMREEPVVYINGRPFVLREESRPLKNMMEYAGIDTPRLEAMEERLKKDVLSEALRHGGRILVAHESFEYGHYGELYDTWEEIDHPDAVLTPAEVYKSLTHQGFQVEYCRCPVTDGTAPTLSDFDSIMNAIMDFGLENPVIFNCQMGIGRTTTGMVIAALVHMYTEGALETARTMPQQLDEILGKDTEGLRGYIVAGMSPRSDNEDHDDYRDAEDERDAKIWELEPEEVEEQKSLAAGGYVGVRRVVRLLEEGEAAKRTLDAIIDTASELLNLRVSIMKYRKPRSSYKYLRPELQQRGAAFKKGCAYLERYCLLLAFSYYLEHVGPERCTFSDFVHSRPDLKAAFESIHANPGAALAPLPVPKQPVVLEETQAGAEEQLAQHKKVLAKRRGRLLTRRTILKSYLFLEDEDALAAKGGVPKRRPKVPEAPDLKKAEDGLPIYSVGSLTAEGLRAVLRWMGAAAGGPSYVCISDIREELVVYVNGTPYTRRELEMPAAALHHAGIRASQLEEQEALMKEDVLDEVSAYNGRILLHKEIDPQTAAFIPQLSLRRSRHTTVTQQVPDPPPPALGTATSSAAAALGTAGSGIPAGAAAAGAGETSAAGASTIPTAVNGSMNGAASSSSTNGAASRTTSLAAAPSGGGLLTAGASLLTAPSTASSLAPPPTPSKKGTNDVTALVDTNPGAEVVGFWEGVSLDSPLSVVTAAELVRHLIEEEGYQATYRRIPLSRERTPEPTDIEELHAQMLEHTAAVPRGIDGSMPTVIHLILSRTSTGSSSRFVAAALCAYHIKPMHARITLSGALPPAGADGHSPAGTHPGPPVSLSQGGLGASGGGAKALDAAQGEYRGIMALCRLLPGGFDAKLTVDRAIALVSPVGNLLEDIHRCKEMADKAPITPMASDPEAVIGASMAFTAARQLGLHYLKRYFLLITYRCFLEQGNMKRTGFRSWAEQQKELAHLMNHLDLTT